MTHEQIDLVQTSFTNVAPLSNEAARIFYRRPFDIAPEVCSRFRGELDEQTRKPITMLAAAVSLEDLDAVAPAAEELAKRHVAYGVTPDHYTPVGDALNPTLNESVGDKFDDATRDAWLPAYGARCDKMIAAANANGQNP